MAVKKTYKPYYPADYTKQMVIAIQAVAAGIANEGQQQLTMKWIIEDLCRTYDLDYFPDSDRDSVFASAKRSIGLQLVKLIKIKTGSLPDDPK